MALNSPIDLEGIYNDYLYKKQEENRLNRYSGNESWYHASGAGSCSRKLYFESVEKIQPTNPLDSRTKRLLKVGNIVHDDIQSSLTHAHYNKVLNNKVPNNVLNTEKEINNKEKYIDFHVLTISDDNF